MDAAVDIKAVVADYAEQQTESWEVHVMKPSPWTLYTTASSRVFWILYPQQSTRATQGQLEVTNQTARFNSVAAAG